MYTYLHTSKLDLKLMIKVLYNFLKLFFSVCPNKKTSSTHVKHTRGLSVRKLRNSFSKLIHAYAKNMDKYREILA